MVPIAYNNLGLQSYLCQLLPPAVQIRDTELTTQMKHLKNLKTARDPKGGCVESPKDEKSIVG